MADNGNLQDLHIRQLLNLIGLARRTGALSFDSHEGHARLYFSEGQLVYATLNGQGAHLAGILHQAGKITQEQAHAIQTVFSSKSDRELGSLLVEMGYASQDDIVQSVRAFFLDSVYTLFTWPEGSFHFEANVLPDEGCFTIYIDLGDIIKEGNRRLKERERLQAELPDLDVELKFADHQRSYMRDINMSAEEWRVIRFIHEPGHTIRQIAQYNSMSDVEIRTIVDSLLRAGLVELVQPEREATPAPSEPPSRTTAHLGRPDTRRSAIQLSEPIQKLGKTLETFGQLLMLL